MRIRSILQASISGSLVVAVTVAAVVTPAAAGGMKARSPTTARTIIMIDGTMLNLTAGGAAAGAGESGTLVSLRLAGRLYEIPLSAVPYLGHGLSWNLFDMSALAAAQADGVLPVRVTYTGRKLVLPGVRITRAADGVADGYLTSASAKTFGAALTRQSIADGPRDSYGTDGIFADRVSVSLLGAARAPVPAGYQADTHPLTVHGIDFAGKPDTGDVVIVVNAASHTVFGGSRSLAVFHNGIASYHVPPGSYEAFAIFTIHNRNGTPIGSRFVALPRFTVKGDSSISLDARTATDTLSVRTPRRAAVSASDFIVCTTDATHSNTECMLFYGQPAPTLYVRPTTTRPAAGGIEAYRYVQLLSPPHVTHPYEYDLQFEDYSGLVPAQHFAAMPGHLATVTDSFYSAARSPHVLWSSGGESRAELRYTQFSFLPAYAVQVPGMLTDYVTAGQPWVVWGAAIQDGYASQYGADASYAPGTTASSEWGNYPLHTAANVSLLGQADLFPTMVSAARAGNVVHLDVVPFSDSTSGHSGQGFSWTGNDGKYQVYANGTKVASGTVTGTILPWTDLAVRAVFPSAPATLRFVVDARRAGPDPLSSSTSTAWTWRTRYVRGAPLPSGWWCGFSRNCSVEPMMTLGYSIRGLSLSGAVSPGAQLIYITVGHIQLAAASPVTGLTAQISLDGGKSWQAARVSRSGTGVFGVSFAAAAGHLVSLRVHAADAGGGQVAETMINAYRIAQTGTAIMWADSK